MSIENNNLKLWDSVSTTDKAFTKQGKKGQHSFTSITPVYRFKNATEAFGIMGIGWGVKIGSEQIGTIEVNDCTLINYDAVLFFKYNGEVGEIPIHASERLSYKTNSGYFKTDEEARKKVVTNAITKGLAGLGFNADVFMGQFDDHEYLQESQGRVTAGKQEEKDDKQDAERNELIAYVKDQAEQIAKATSAGEAKGIHKVAARFLSRKACIIVVQDIATRGMAKLAKDKDEKLKELEDGSAV